MSELTMCNYCSLRSMERRARGRGEKVLILDGTPSCGLPAGVEVYVVPVGAGVTRKDLRGEIGEKLREKYRRAWFMELTSHCVC